MTGSDDQKKRLLKPHEARDQALLDLRTLQAATQSNEGMGLIGCVTGAVTFMLLGAMGLFDGFVYAGYYGPSGELAALRILIICRMGLAGFIISWFFSPNAGPFRLFGLGFIASGFLYFAIVDYGVQGWEHRSGLKSAKQSKAPQ